MHVASADAAAVRSVILSNPPAFEAYQAAERARQVERAGAARVYREAREETDIVALEAEYHRVVRRLQASERGRGGPTLWAAPLDVILGPANPEETNIVERFNATMDRLNTDYQCACEAADSRRDAVYLAVYGPDSFRNMLDPQRDKIWVPNHAAGEALWAADRAREAERADAARAYREARDSADIVALEAEYRRLVCHLGASGRGRRGAARAVPPCAALMSATAEEMEIVERFNAAMDRLDADYHRACEAADSRRNATLIAALGPGNFRILHDAEQAAKDAKQAFAQKVDKGGRDLMENELQEKRGRRARLRRV